jgi:hypothetical protein
MLVQKRDGGKKDTQRLIQTCAKYFLFYLQNGIGTLVELRERYMESECVDVCVCVCERERMRENEKK